MLIAVGLDALCLLRSSQLSHPVDRPFYGLSVSSTFIKAPGEGEITLCSFRRAGSVVQILSQCCIEALKFSANAWSVLSDSAVIVWKAISTSSVSYLYTAAKLA